MATQSSMAPEDMAEHKRTYALFVRGVAVVAAHALVILAILAWVFSAQMG
jgi:Bacterial aa3 type cytochrome c oxidase subunit IV